MGFFSWMSSCGTVGEDEPPSLIRYNDSDRELGPRSSGRPPRTWPGSSRTTSTSTGAPQTTSEQPCQWLGGTSRAGLRSKKPNGLSQKATASVGITGQSSGRVM